MLILPFPLSPFRSKAVSLLCIQLFLWEVEIILTLLMKKKKKKELIERRQHGETKCCYHYLSLIYQSSERWFSPQFVHPKEMGSSSVVCVSRVGPASSVTARTAAGVVINLSSFSAVWKMPLW